MSADLDDFFAKKDKNRKKKTKGISNEDFVQKYEAKCKDMINEKRHEEVLSNLEGFIQDDGEWKDFEEEKDYTGLKIQILTLDDEEQREKEEEEIKKEVTELPWTKKETDKKEEEEETKSEEKLEEEEEKPKEPEPEKPEEKVSLFFKFRQKQAEKTVAVQGPRLDDESEFPDLGALPEEVKPPATVNRSNTRPVPSTPAPPPPLRSDFSTGNKYNLLRNNN